MKKTHQEDYSISITFWGNMFENIHGIGLTSYSQVNAAGKPYGEDQFLIL